MATATYRVKGPDGTLHDFSGPEGATPEQVEQAAAAQFGSKAASAGTAALAAPARGEADYDPNTSSSSYYLNKAKMGVSDLLGMPVETVKNLVNLSTAARGYIQNKVMGTSGDDLPALPFKGESFGDTAFFNRLLDTKPDMKPASPVNKFVGSATEAAGQILGGGAKTIAEKEGTAILKEIAKVSNVAAWSGIGAATAEEMSKSPTPCRGIGALLGA